MGMRWTIDDNGKLTENANSWAKQFLSDIESMNFEAGMCFLDEWNRNIRALFLVQDIKDDFVAALLFHTSSTARHTLCGH